MDVQTRNRAGIAVVVTQCPAAGIAGNGRCSHIKQILAAAVHQFQNQSIAGGRAPRRCSTGEAVRTALGNDEAGAVGAGYGRAVEIPLIGCQTRRAANRVGIAGFVTSGWHQTQVRQRVHNRKGRTAASGQRVHTGSGVRTGLQYRDGRAAAAIAPGIDHVGLHRRNSEHRGRTLAGRSGHGVHHKRRRYGYRHRYGRGYCRTTIAVGHRHRISRREAARTDL